MWVKKYQAGKRGVRSGIPLWVIILGVLNAVACDDKPAGISGREQEREDAESPLLIVEPDPAGVYGLEVLQFSASLKYPTGRITPVAVNGTATGGEVSADGTYIAAPVLLPVPKQSAIQFGLHTDLTWYDNREYRRGLIQKAKAVNAVISRNAILWHLVEPEQGVRDWSILDSTIDDLLTEGIEPVMVVLGSPSWANGVAAAGDPHHYLVVPSDPSLFDQWVSEYKTFMRAAARRYRDKVRLWEIGNEQNWTHFWRPRPSVEQYAHWYDELRRTIKSENPDAVIALGGLTLLAKLDSMIGKNISGVTFLETMYTLGVFPDAVAVHPYTDNGAGPDVHVEGAGNFDDIEAIRKVMVQHGHQEDSIWVTEWGWSSAEVTPEVLAAYLRRSLELIDTRYSPYVTIATYFTLVDLARHYGLYDVSGRLKPSGLVFRDFLRTR